LVVAAEEVVDESPILEEKIIDVGVTSGSDPNLTGEGEVDSD
jgi:hypothetical protein